MAHVQTDLGRFFETDEFTTEIYSNWQDSIYSSLKSCQEFRSLLDERADKAESGLPALRVAIGLLICGRPAEALEKFSQATDSKYRRFYAAQAAEALGRFEQAAADYERAAARGWDEMEANLRAAAAQVKAGNAHAAKSVLSKYASTGKDRADWHYLDGLMKEVEGAYTPATESFEKALILAPDDARVMFRCAYLYDLHGDDEKAIELYERLALQPGAHVNALLNLSVLYEDLGRYRDAQTCLHRVLAVNPNHLRARLFLRDVQSSMGMMISEDGEPGMDAQSKLLETPISEFELSMRSRNCLKKMNINTLGDLLKISDAELLAYKNFGETSLAEIRALLTSKGLRVGQALEGFDAAAVPAAPPPPVTPKVVVPPGAEAALSKPVAELELSVRARKCLQRLNISTVGELISRTEPELLAIRNFGVTSLNEIKERLADLGLSLAAG